MERHLSDQQMTGSGEEERLRRRARSCRDQAVTATDSRLQAMLNLLAQAYDQRAAVSSNRGSSRRAGRSPARKSQA